MRIVHISDPHLSSLENVRPSQLRGKRLLGYQSWYRRRRRQFKIETLDQVTQAIRDESANLVIVSGDLVHIGLECELLEARAWLESLGNPDEVLVAPGNHDCYHAESWPLVQRIYQPYLGVRNEMDPTGDYPVLRRADGVSIITASSAAPAPWWAASGTLGVDQRTRLASMLHDERENLRILVLHHPPLPGMASFRKALTDADALMAILEDTKPQITLHGHLHRNQALTTPQGRIFCTAPASSVRERAPASYRVFEIAAQPDHWRIDMTLKSLVQGKIAITAEASWNAASKFETRDTHSLDSSESENACPQ
ncbi:MAG: metallophosphoesterase [Gammaproteobacteria bacterium]|nr:metallophosphoesterase [Gammaproteobacteria bacterium]